MSLYQLSEDAEQDLKEVARYTLNKWGKNYLNDYRKGLKQTFDRLVDVAPNHPFPDVFPDLCVFKYRFHYIFYLIEAKPVIVGVIHERRDIVSRLSERLS